jgi:hypothetical protein
MIKNLLTAFLLFPFLVNAQWDHSTYRATSTDGFNWTRDTTQLLYPASVPKAVVDTNGKIWIYYIYTANQNSMETIMVASSTDGKNFSTAQQITMSNNVTANRFDPKPVLLKDGRIRIYYVDATILPPKDVYSAVSSDGINFTEENGKRFEKNEITDPDVFIADSGWVLYVPSINGMIRAISYDEGLTFTQDTTFSWTQASVFGTYKFDSLSYRTFYCNQGDIISATSTNGYDLAPDSGIRVAALANEYLCDPSVVELNGEYILYFKSQPEQTNKLDDPSTLLNIEVFPNPIRENEDLKIKLSYNDQYAIYIFNSLGKEVIKMELNAEENFLSLDAFSSGLYFYSIKNNNQIIKKGSLMLFD